MNTRAPCSPVFITGGHGTWEDMRALNPFCMMDGVMLQCDMQETGWNELPIAYICGVIGRKNTGNGSLRSSGKDYLLERTE